MATLRDVAREAQTSISAASAVLNGVGQHNIRVGKVTRERILSAASALGYRPNLLARSLVTRKSGALGLVFPYRSAFIDQNPFCMQVMSGVMEAAVCARHNLMLHTELGDGWYATEESALADPRVDGQILVLPQPGSPAIEHRRADHPYRVAVVYAPCSPHIYAVNADDYQGGRQAAEHLLSRGHRRIAHLMGAQNVATTHPRQQGFCTALAEAGVELLPEWLVQSGLDWADGYRDIDRLIDLPPQLRPTALFAANDLSADGAMRRLQERGLCVPEDLAMVGFDDTWYATMMRPALTSVHMPIREMSIRATEMLIALVEGHEPEEHQPILSVSLTVRDSS